MNALSLNPMPSDKTTDDRVSALQFIHSPPLGIGLMIWQALRVWRADRPIDNRMAHNRSTWHNLIDESHPRILTCLGFCKRILARLFPNSRGEFACRILR